MPTIEQIRQKYSDNIAIQCICDAFPSQQHNIAMRARSPLKVLEVLMWNRGVHMVMAGVPHHYPTPYDTVDHELWKDVFQIGIDSEVFSTDNIISVDSTIETPHGVLVWFTPPTSTKNTIQSTFRKKLLKIKRKFAEFDSWGESVLEPYVP